MHRAGLVRGDLVVDGVSADEFADQFAPATSRSNATNVEHRAEFLLNLAQTGGHDLDRAAVGAQVDFVEQIAVTICDHQVSGDRTDVDAEISLDPRAVARDGGFHPTIAQEDDLLHRELVAAGELLFGGSVLLELMNALKAALARFFTFEECSTNGADPRIKFRDDELLVSELEGVADGIAYPGVHRHSANEGDRSRHGAALDDRRLKIARDRLAKTTED